MFAIRLGLASVLAIAALSAHAAAGSTGIDTSGNYKQEVEACKTGQTQQDRATCLREAGSARAEKQRGALGKPDSQLEANATARCDVLTGEDKTACLVRIQGRGETTGSVAGGGVLREVETVVVPAGSGPVVIQPKTADPVVLVPIK